MVHRVVAPFASVVAAPLVVVAAIVPTAIVALRLDPPLGLYPLVSAPWALAPLSLACPATPVLLPLALPVWLFLAATLGLCLGGLLRFLLDSVVAPKICLRHLC